MRVRLQAKAASRSIAVVLPPRAPKEPRSSMRPGVYTLGLRSLDESRHRAPQPRPMNGRQTRSTCRARLLKNCRPSANATASCARSLWMVILGSQ